MTDFDAADGLHEIHSDEGPQYGLPWLPLAGADLAPDWVRPN